MTLKPKATIKGSTETKTWNVHDFETDKILFGPFKSRHGATKAAKQKKYALRQPKGTPRKGRKCGRKLKKTDIAISEITLDMNQPVGPQLRAIRKSINLSQSEQARRMKMDVANVAAYENARYQFATPKINLSITGIAYARALGVSKITLILQNEPQQNVKDIC